MNNNIVSPTDLQLNDETVVQIKRVSKATTGGRRMRFNCIVVVGDGNGHVGVGLGKANEVASAVNKAKEVAKKRIFKTKIFCDTADINEIKRLQTFPDNHQFFGNFIEQWRQIGNAVPPLLAYYIGQSFRNYLSTLEQETPVITYQSRLELPDLSTT